MAATAATGTRVNLNNHIGTIKYVGPVNNTTGIWLGVEWDDPARGKHDGSKDGKQYFTCQLKNAGSFIRPTSHLVYGVSFLVALTSKYVEALHGSDTQEIVVLGSSQGTIQVEAVSLDKIRQKFARLDQLREISLEHANVVNGDEPGRILESCPNVRGLDLSSNLLPRWEAIAEITRELPLLRRLSLNRNRLQSPANLQPLEGAFQSLTDLQLNGTFLSWKEMQAITSTMPRLQLIEMGYNCLSHLSGGMIQPHDCNVQVINIDTNNCSDWFHLCASFSEYHSLQRIILTSNRINLIPFPNRPEEPLLTIKYLSLSNNLLNAWSDIDALSCWFPALETLTISGNPLLANDTQLGKHSRPFITARIPSLLVLDGAAISSKERTDSELFYMSIIMQQGPTSDDARRKNHYHWLDLCNKHGTPQEVSEHKSHDKLGNRLIELKLGRSCDEAQATVASLRVLPTMSLRNLRFKICKTLKLDARNTDLNCWLQMSDGTLVTLGHENDSRDLDWLGMESGSQIIYDEGRQNT